MRSILLITLLLTTGCNKILDLDAPVKAPDPTQADADEANERKPDVAKEDAEAQRILNHKSEEHEKPVDTVEFFANSEKYMIWKGDRDAFKKLFEEIRTAGAPATHAVCSDTFGKMVAASFIITLPEDPAARKKVIELHNGFWTKMVDPDAGQKHIMLTYDP